MHRTLCCFRDCFRMAMERTAEMGGYSPLGAHDPGKRKDSDTLVEP